MSLSEKEKRNQQRYRQAFSALKIPASVNLAEEKTNMKPSVMRRKLSAIAGAAAILMTATCVYAADVGGIRTTVAGWFKGEKVTFEAVPNGDNGYDFYKEGSDVPEFGGGGIIYERDGSETPMSAQELLENSTGEDLRLEEDGTVMLYLKDRSYDITKWCEYDKPAYFIATVDGNIRYMTVTIEDKGNSTSFSSDSEPFDGVAEYIELD